MLKVITKEIPIDEELKTRIQFICDFCNVEPIIINGSIRKVEKTTDEYRDVKELSANLNIITKQARQDSKRIKNLKESNDALQLRVDSLSEKVETQEKQINEYRKDNFNLKYQLQELKQLFEKLINFLKRMFNRKDKEDVYVEVVSDMYNHQIISEKTFDRITGCGNEKSKKKDDYEICL